MAFCFEKALKEREAEIVAQKESLVIRNRLGASERSEIKCAINERKMRIKQLQTRYETAVAVLGQTPDGEPMSTTYLTIRSTQERYMLQEQGDKLDEAIRKTEQEIQCMENTLRVVNSCNDKYKINTGSIDPNGPEMSQQKQLQEDTHRVKLTLKQKRSDLQQIIQQIQVSFLLFWLDFIQIMIRVWLSFVSSDWKTIVKDRTRILKK